MDHSAGSKTENLLMECSLVSHAKRSRVSCSYVSSIESNHAIHFCSKLMHAKIQCLSLILTGMSILEHVNMFTYLVSLAKLSAAIVRYLNDPKKGISVPLRCYLRSAFPMLVHEERAGPCLVPTQNPALSKHRYRDRPMFRSVKPMPCFFVAACE